MGIVERTPIHLDCELTTKCNYSCPFCERTIHNIKPEDMPLELVYKIIDEFASKGGSSIKFVYLGEPLLYPRLYESIKYAKQKGIIDTIIATNGSLLRKGLGLRLIKAGIDWINFSIDSADIVSYKKLRTGNLDVVRENIIQFYSIRKALKLEKPLMVIQCIEQEENREEIKSGEFQKYWSPYCDKIEITRLEHYDIKEPLLQETPEFFCENPWRRMTVRVNGDIALCCGQRLDSKVLGNIYKDSIEEIWKSDKMNYYRNLMKSGNSHRIEPCQTCSYRYNFLYGDKV